jgi:hypothetical protein
MNNKPKLKLTPAIQELKDAQLVEDDPSEETNEAEEGNCTEDTQDQEQVPDST